MAKLGNTASENTGSLMRIIINRLSKKSGEASFSLEGLFRHKF